MKNLKKKLAVIACAAMLIVMAVGGSTIAYFTDTDSAENTFTYGSVTIDQLENGGNTPIHATKFLPIVNTSKPNADENFVKKDVTVKNTSTTTDAYVRTFIAVPSKLYTSGALQMVFEKNFGGAWELSGKYERYMGESEPENIYVVFVYTYIGTNTTTGFEAVSGRLKAENQTTSLLKGVYTSERADVREFNGEQHVIMWNTAGNVTGNDYVDTGYVLNNNREFSIFVNTQAVQADGFGSASDAFATAFGNKDPWDTLIPSNMPDSIEAPSGEYIYN